jgi:hypothetical protein
MAVHDHDRRIVDDYLHSARVEEKTAPPSLFGVVAAVVFVLLMLYVLSSGAPNRPESTELPSTPTSTTAPTSQPQ